MNLTCMPNNAAGKRYTSRFIPAITLYVVAILLAAWLFKHHTPHGLLAYLLALLPALAIIATIIITGLYLAEEKDEFQRNVLIQSMLWGIGLTLAVTTLWGFLEMFSLAPHFQAFSAFPLFWLFVGIATPILKRNYR